MSLRWRLALWYGALTGLVVLSVTVLTYAIHSRAHYDELDRTLLIAATHVAQEYVASPPSQVNQVLSREVAPDAVVEIYDHNGGLLASGPQGSRAPQIDPRTTFIQRSPSPYDPIVRLAPPIMAIDPGDGHFWLATTSAQERWRVYVLPITALDQYLVVEAPLSHVDASVDTFRRLVLLLSVLAATITLVAGWLLAGRALRPVSLLTETAGTIARSRHFDQRIKPLTQQDEMGRLASTFNAMLDSLEQAYQHQQRFVSDASHELRAPLTAIQANLELLERHPDMGVEEQREVVDEASREAQRLARLVADLLALARADAGVPMRKQRLELDRIMLEALNDARHLAHGQQLEVTTLEPVLVNGDPDRLKQLLLILLDNALKYTPAGGRIALALTRTSDHATITVQDFGVGVSPEDLPHVFERFYRADPARSRDPGGTGLGLPIARWIVEQHNGDIVLASQLGSGTTATITLPTLS